MSVNYKQVDVLPSAVEQGLKLKENVAYGPSSPRVLNNNVPVPQMS